MNAYKQHLFQSKVTWKTNFNSISNYQPQSLINLIGVSSVFYTDVGKKFENYIKKVETIVAQYLWHLLWVKRNYSSCKS